MDPQLLDAINVIFLTIFVVLVALALARIGIRYLEYKKENLPIPKLLYRDFLLLFGLGLPFLGGLLFRALNVIVREQPWYPAWVIITGVIAIGGVAYFVWYEYFKIEK